MRNILVTSFGITWPIVPELIGFTNPDIFDFYKNHPEHNKITKQRKDYDIQPVDEIWLAATNGDFVKEQIEKLKNWFTQNKQLPKLRIFSYSILKELDTIKEIEPMADLIFRVVLHAKNKTQGGKLYLSLAGGRKNMSANMQEAATIFGCDALLHVMSHESKNIHSSFKSETEFEGFYKIPGNEVECFYPVVLSGKKEESPIVFSPAKLKPEAYPLKEKTTSTSSLSLYNEISSRQKDSANTLFNLYQNFNKKDSQNIYLGFHLLSPRIKERLKEEHIGNDFNRKEKEIRWLKRLPKADLHCHFGGILSPEEMVEVAKENKEEVEKYLKENNDFKKWYEGIRQMLSTNKEDKLPPYNPKKDIREYWTAKNIKEPIAISAFLSLFEGKTELLQKYIYSNTGNFKSIGIEHYEKLGDLQGSSLMQNEKSIRKACQILKSQCKEHNIKYLEVRCSPENYTRGGLSSKKVVEILIDEFYRIKHTVFKLIFIASRHGTKETIEKHINLALELLKNNDRFKKLFVGFDLAGAEKVVSPKELRETFMDILEQSIPTTIHAGEDMSVKNIWEAVYHLSAERIGHGLTLNDDKNLKQRIKERKIAIELCPSSNDQIIGYNDFCQNNQTYKEYPLKRYLTDGLKITINTDDPGISLTNITNEYYKAACMTKGGLSKWEILQINRNGFKYGFLPVGEKKKLLLDVEKELFKLLNNE